MFLPVVMLMNFLLPKAARNYMLLITSLFFYAWGEPRFVFVMAGSIAFNYLIALKISESEQVLLRRFFLLLGVLGNLALLFSFKYLNFAIRVLHDVLPATQQTIAQTDIALPIGISFFTFQALSYVIDVYRNDVRVQKNPLYLGLYISFFPQLIAGPIVRYTTIEAEISNRRVTYDDLSLGALRFCKGLAKKVLLANILSAVADSAFESSAPGAGFAWLGVVCYALQIYYDFSGYSDMAIGLGRMFGFHFLENFNYPYISASISEFWRRWHISLGTWFRDYVYFPMGGSRVQSKFRLVFNLLVVWSITGFWHGASWNFLCWGFLYGVLIALEKLTGIPARFQHRPARIVYRAFTLLFILMGWVMFRAASLSAAWQYIRNMFGASGILFGAAFWFNLREYAVYIAAALLFSTPVLSMLMEKSGRHAPRLGSFLRFIGDAVLLLLLITAVSELVMGTNNPFIYFNF
jgi:D-alanyl-lipoteichoic acid acyltransferase DltB (MBOAT superfamily)